MTGSCFLDTNIFIYSLDRSEPEKSKVALKLIREQSSRRSGVISFQVVQEFFSAAGKKFKSAMTLEESTEYLLTVLEPLLSVHSSTALYAAGLAIHKKYKISWYDSLIVAAASEAKCRILYSEDMQHGTTINGVRIENPFPRPS